MNKIIGSIQAQNTTFVWKITDFSNICTKVRKYIESPFFTVGEVSSNTVKFQLVCYPFGKNDDCKDFLSVYLICFFGEDILECDISYEFYLWGSESGLNIYHDVKLTTANTSVRCLKFRQREGQEIQKNVSVWNDDSIRIACCINRMTTHYKHKINQQTELIESFDALFLSDSFSDVTIEVDDKKLKAHKNILAVRSEVFSAMFKHNTVESIENTIRITDFSYNVIKEVLRFIYCGKVKNLETHKEDLLAAADKYDLKFLKRICEQSIWMNMNANHIWEILNMSDLYNCTELKTNAVNYVTEHLQEVVDYPEFKQVSASNPNLIGELLREAAKKLRTVKCYNYMVKRL